MDMVAQEVAPVVPLLLREEEIVGDEDALDTGLRVEVADLTLLMEGGADKVGAVDNDCD